MEIFLIRALQLILCFALLILLHEGGHFFFAKLFRVRVEKFCLFFDPWFTPVKFKPKGSDTVYALGWLPLGGYVSIAGMVDETTSSAELSEKVEPWEFRAKPAWQRLLIMLGGVMVNLLVAFFLYAMVLFTWGDRYIPVQEMSHGFAFNEEARRLGFQDGDILLRTDAGEITRFEGATYRQLSTAHRVDVLRQGQEVSLTMPEDGLNLLSMIQSEPRFCAPLLPSVIDTVMPESAAAKAGIQSHDRMIGYHIGTAESAADFTADELFTTWNEYGILRSRLQDILAAGDHADSLRLRTASVLVVRETKDTLLASLALPADYMMGIQWSQVPTEYRDTVVQYGFWESFPAGARYGWSVLSGYVSDLRYLATAEGAKSVGSFGAIGSLFPTAWDWHRFWELTAFISIILAFMNVLPIPALDGGHAFFLLVEVITRRKPSEKFMDRAQKVGMFLLLALMIFALFNDFRNFVL